MSVFLEAVNWRRGKSNRGQRDHKAKSFFITSLAFVLVGSAFFYFVNWFSEVNRNRGDEVVQAATIIVLKKLPPVVGNELVSILSNKGMEYQSAIRSEGKPVREDGRPALDLLEMPIVVKKSLPPTPDNKKRPETPSNDFQADGTSSSELPAAGNIDLSPAPEELDPASPIDYVIQKRRHSL